MIDIRPLEPSEVGDLIALARAMHAESPVYSPHPFEEAKLAAWAKLCIESDDWLCLMAWDVATLTAIGFIAVGACEMLFSTEKTIDDLGLYVVPEKRGTTAAVRLVRSMEGWATGRGAVIRLGVTTGTNAAQAQRFLERLGYVQTGTLLTKPT